jgi:dipeptidyl-peptidase 4
LDRSLPVKSIACLAAVVCLFVSLAPAQAAAPEKKLSIEAIFAEGGLTGRVPENLKWSPDNTRVAFMQRDDPGDRGELWYFDTASGEKKLLVSDVKLANLSPSLNKITDEREKERVTRYHVAAYLWSPDSKTLLFDSMGQLWFYTIEGGVAVQATSSPDSSTDPKFSPKGDHIAFVRKHNLYVAPVSGEGEKQITNDKDENLLDGEVDWVYAEELGVRSNYFWSPNGKDIAYLQMNEAAVPTYPIVDWMPTHPVADLEKYPKAGDPNPSVRIGVAGSSGGKTKWITLGEDKDIYIPRFGWVRDGVLWAQVLNRAQNQVDLYFIDAHSGSSRKVLTDTIADGWLYISDDFSILKSGDRFVWTSWRDGNNHAYLYSFDGKNPLSADARMEKQLTQGDFQVLEINGVDETTGTVFYTANKEDPREEQIYAVKLDGSGDRRVSQENGVHNATFSDDAEHYVDQRSALLYPLAFSACGTDGACKSMWEPRSVEGYGLRSPKMLEFQAEDGTKLYGSLLLPPVGATGNKVPLIIYVYGGPAEQLVRNRWAGATGLFHQRLAQEGFAIFTVDNRGTPNRDRKFQTAIRHQFGAVELKDQLAALDQLLTQYPQLDKDRIGIWGWSNGGSMTLYALSHSDRFKTGVSVAPVTDQRNYDTIYTERYMGLPKDNAAGYAGGSASAVADKIHGSLLLVHGTSDDNVHFQNTIQMVDALIKAGKQFELMTYPGKTHSISGAAARTHLFHMIEDHFQKELK